MLKYNCEKCEFQTNNKTDYKRHNGTKKHIEKVCNDASKSKTLPIKVQNDSKPIEKYTCQYCQSSYSSQSNLTKHMKKCANKQIKDAEMDTLKKENEKLKEQVELFLEIIKSTMTVGSVNNLTYIINNYGSAPPLKQLTSYGHIHTAKTMSLVDVLIMYHREGTLCKFIGDFLVNSYLKKEADRQSMWSTDVSRLTYIVNELHESGKIKWVMDKKGIKVKKYVICPLLDYLLNELKKYVKVNSRTTKLEIVNNLQTILEMYTIFDKDILANDIIRYMAPYFCLMREDDDNIKQIEGPKLEIIKN